MSGGFQQWCWRANRAREPGIAEAMLAYVRLCAEFREGHRRRDRRTQESEEAVKLKVMNRATGKLEEKDPFDRAFLEFAVQTTSQYDSTCRRMAAQILASEAEVARLTRELDTADGRRREGRQLLVRMVKYCREDKATTARATRLERLVEQVADYLNRTHEPRDILRQEKEKADG